MLACFRLILGEDECLGHPNAAGEDFGGELVAEGAVAAQHAGEHCHSLLGEGIGRALDIEAPLKDHKL